MSNKEKPEWLEELEKAPLTSRLRRKESLKRFNTWRIGGVAECLIDVVNVEDLEPLTTLHKQTPHSLVHPWQRFQPVYSRYCLARNNFAFKRRVQKLGSSRRK